MYEAFNGWICWRSEGCDGGGCDHVWGHEPSCGLNPLVRCHNQTAAEAVVGVLNVMGRQMQHARDVSPVGEVSAEFRAGWDACVNAVRDALTPNPPDGPPHQ